MANSRGKSSRKTNRKKEAQENQEERGGSGETDRLHPFTTCHPPTHHIPGLKSSSLPTHFPAQLASVGEFWESKVNLLITEAKIQRPEEAEILCLRLRKQGVRTQSSNLHWHDPARSPPLSEGVLLLLKPESLSFRIPR